jgi:hypothetical protein
MLMVIRCQKKSTAPAFHAPTSACHPIGDDCKHPTFFQLLSCFHPPTESSSVFKKLNLFPDFRRRFSLVLSTNGHKHSSVSRHETNIRCKSEEDVYAFGIQIFWSFHFKSWSKIQNSQFPPICLAKSSSSMRQLQQAYL